MLEHGFVWPQGRAELKFCVDLIYILQKTQKRTNLPPNSNNNNNNNNQRSGSFSLDQLRAGLGFWDTLDLHWHGVFEAMSLSIGC